jgi:beta-lactamase regulating signal transducer with metallopeptidase domain
MHLAAMIGDLERMAPAVWPRLSLIWESVAQNAGTVLVTSIWQGAVIVCGLEIAMRLMPRISAAHRFAVWASGFVIAAGLPMLPLIHFGTGSAEAAIAGNEVPAQALLQIDARWGLALAGIWVIASAFRIARLVMHFVRLRRLWKAAEPARVSENLLAALQNVRGGNVRICTTEQLDRPSVIGFFAPRVLIPKWLIERLTDGELDQIVQHEAEHLRRFDDWTNLFQKILLVLFPLNPALAWMEHRLCREREMACDEGVVRITNAPRAYAACLASLAEHGLERKAEALSLGAWHKRSELVHRVHGILLRKRGMSRAAAAALLGAVGCALAAGTVEMARCPQFIAFVPEQKALAMTTARQQQLEAMLAREDSETKMMLPPGYRAVQAKAIEAPVHHARLNARKRESVKAPSMKSSDSEIAQQQVAKSDATAASDLTGDRVNPGTEQQWVVLAAWEEVHTISRTSNRDQVADFDANAPRAQADNPKATGQNESKIQTPAANSYTVTQLILRVVPANRKSDSTQPATGMLRGGWLVIQL